MEEVASGSNLLLWVAIGIGGFIFLIVLARLIFRSPSIKVSSPEDIARQARIGAAQSSIQQIDPAIRQQAYHLVALKKKIEAIKLIREYTGMGLKEAKDYVEQELEPQVQWTAQSAPFDSSANFEQPAVAQNNQWGFQEPQAKQMNPTLQQEMLDLLAANQKIAAIKLVREATGMGLKEAKDYVESYE